MLLVPDGEASALRLRLGSRVGGRGQAGGGGTAARERSPPPPRDQRAGPVPGSAGAAALLGTQPSGRRPRSAFDDRPASEAHGRPLIEGDGWVNWSGLATLLATSGSSLATSARRLLS